MCRWSLLTWKWWKKENDSGDNENRGSWRGVLAFIMEIYLIAFQWRLHLKTEESFPVIKAEGRVWRRLFPLPLFFKGLREQNRASTCCRNGLFHYSASLPWMSHPAGCSLDKTMPSQGIALQRQKGLASIHRNIGMPPCHFIHIKD